MFARPSGRCERPHGSRAGPGRWCNVSRDCRMLLPALMHVFFFGVWRPYRALRYRGTLPTLPPDRKARFRRVALDAPAYGLMSLATLFLLVGLPRLLGPGGATRWRFADWIDWGWPGVSDVAIGLAALALLAAVDLAYGRYLRSQGSPYALGDVPGRSDRLWWIALSVSTGIGEEMTWRVVQPMLIMGLTGSAPLAIILSALAFGTGHFRGGRLWAGITVLFGLVLQALTLKLDGGFYIAACVHVSVNAASGLVPSVLGAPRQDEAAG